ncbi:high mobility group protein hmg-12-like [Liolophura sinensis]|uniref:high mobility group protein hmg-12-like n=1 Tax=Liolophura sinensis TaxID=3198878 RepID=UPI0031589D49
MADAKTQLTRDGTMQVTAKEGIEYLQAAKKDTLLELQGLKPGDTGAPSLARAGTMAVTAKEGNALLGESKPDADALTRGQQRKIDEISSEKIPQSPAKKPRMSKDNTMVGTAKEAKALLGNEKLGDTRQETKAKQKKTPVKRETTMAKTMKEAQDILVGATEVGRRTRSQSRGDTKPSPPKRAGTMQSTAKEGKEFLKRGKKGNKASEEDEGEDEDAEKDEATE